MDKMIKSKMETPFFDTEVINMGELDDLLELVGDTYY